MPVLMTSFPFRTDNCRRNFAIVRTTVFQKLHIASGSNFVGTSVKVGALHTYCTCTCLGDVRGGKCLNDLFRVATQ